MAWTVTFKTDASNNQLGLATAVWDSGAAEQFTVSLIIPKDPVFQQTFATWAKDLFNASKGFLGSGLTDDAIAAAITTDINS